DPFHPNRLLSRHCPSPPSLYLCCKSRHLKRQPPFSLRHPVPFSPLGALDPNIPPYRRSPSRPSVRKARLHLWHRPHGQIGRSGSHLLTPLSWWRRSCCYWWEEVSSL